MNMISSKVAQEPLGASVLPKNFGAVFAAEGDEKPRAAAVTVRRQTDVFVPEFRRNIS
jgi:hypothetical protein